MIYIIFLVLFILDCYLTGKITQYKKEGKERLFYEVFKRKSM